MSQLIDELRVLIGDRDFAAYGGKWADAVQYDPEAVRQAIREMRSAREPVRNAGGWLWKAYNEARRASLNAPVR